MKDKFGKSVSKVLLLVLLFAGWGNIANAQTVQLGSGPGTSDYIPFYYLYEKGYSQTIYTSNELIAAGMDPNEGLITKIRFKATTSQSTSNWQDWEIYMGNTTQGGFSSGSNWVTLANLSPVFNGQIAANVVAGQWLEITLTNAFQWDGTSNIVVAVNETTGNYGNDPSWASYTLAPSTGSKGIYAYQDGTSYNPASPPSGTTINNVAQIQFDGILQSACTGAPTAGTVSATMGMCAGQASQLLATGSTIGVSGLIGQWQSHEVGSIDPWLDISGGTTNPYTIPSAPGVPMEYRYILACGSDADTTNIMTTSINPISQCYCAPGATDASKYIDNFSTTNGIQNITNAGSGFSTGGYGQFLTDTLSQTKGQSVNFNVDIVGGTSGFRVWVDWGQDGVFDISDMAYQSTGYLSNHTGTITVPSFALSGPTRMRIVSHWLSSTGDVDPCQTGFTYGEFEDYTFNVIVPEAPSITQATGTPSCVLGTDLTASGTLGTDETWYWQITADGTDTGNDASTPWTVFENGTYYVRTYDSNYAVWSDADSIEITNMPSEAAPSAPVAAQNPVCLPGTQITMDPAPTGIEYYWQGTSSISSLTTDNASAPYDVTQTGTYYVKAYNPATQCWSESVGTTVDVQTEIPNDPIADPSAFNFCENITSAEITANTTVQGSETSLSTPINYDYTCGGGVMFDVTNTSPAGITITALDAASGSNVVPTAKVYYKAGTHLGSEENPSAWTLLGVYNTPGAANTIQNIDIDDFDIPAGATYGIFIKYYAVFTEVSSVQTFSDANITITSGSGLCSEFGGINELMAFNGTVYYKPAVPTAAIWYDAATGGNVLGTTNTLETVGTSVLPTVLAGSYDFYVASSFNVCESDNRTLVTVNVNPVNVDLVVIDATCNNGDNGSFLIDNTECGVFPFTFSVDGGSFGPIPTDLTAGDHTVIVKDDGGDESAVYTITIGSAAAPSGLTVDDFTNDEITFSWTANGDESSWNVEWGVPGFAPGTGAGLGSAVATTNPFTITGLSGDTDYDIYVSSNCGGTTTPGDWSFLKGKTDCDAMIAIGYCQDFEDLSDFDCWRFVDNNGDDETWSIYSGQPHSGIYSAGIHTDYLGGNNDDYLILPQMTLTGTEAMTYYYKAMSSTEPNDYRVLLSTTGRDVADFTEILFVDTVSNDTYQDMAINLSDYVGDVYIAFHVPPGGLDGYYLFIDDICIEDCSIAPGTDGSTDVCREDGTVDLNTVITAGDPSGSWAFPSNPDVINVSTLSMSTMSSGSYQAYYVVENVCFSDTTVATLDIYGPSSAGIGNTIHACKYAPLNLYSALSGNIDIGGDWYDFNGSLLPNSQPTSPGITASYNYKYIVSNGVCPADTSIIEVIVDNCVWVGLDEESFTNISVYPNPASDQINIMNPSNASDLKVQVLDVNGRVVLVDNGVLKNSSKATIAIDQLAKGIYTLRIYNDEGQKIFKVVKQ